MTGGWGEVENLGMFEFCYFKSQKSERIRLKNIFCDGLPLSQGLVVPNQKPP